MSMQPHPYNPIEVRKQQTRRNARNALLCVVGGVGGGVVLALLWSTVWLVLGLLVAVGGGVYYGGKVRKAIAADPNSPY